MCAAIPRKTKNDLKATQVRGDNGYPAIVHHGTLGVFPAKEIAAFSHFGTRRAARARMGGWSGEPRENARLISAFLDIRNPLYLSDLNNTHDLQRVLNLIAFSEADKIFDRKMREEILFHEQETGEGLERLSEILEANGYDGIGYRNLHEDPGSMSWIIFRPEQMVIVADGRLCDARDPWDLTEAEWTGPAIVMEVFDIDGRAEEFAHLFEALENEGEDLPALASNDEGWEARWLHDWDPPGTMGLFSPDGEPKGFYMGGMLWIDPDARGFGRSSLMINAAAELLGGCPAQNRDGLGYSPAGYAAHLAAHRQVITRAIEDGYLDEPVCAADQEPL